MLNALQLPLDHVVRPLCISRSQKKMSDHARLFKHLHLYICKKVLIRAEMKIKFKVQIVEW